MLRLALLLYVFIGATLAGSAIVAVLSAGMATTRPVVVAALVGFLVAMPVSWAVARRLSRGR